jgi:hypothetical protein
MLVVFFLQSLLSVVGPNLAEVCSIAYVRWRTCAYSFFSSNHQPKLFFRRCCSPDQQKRVIEVFILCWSSTSIPEKTF